MSKHNVSLKLSSRRNTLNDDNSLLVRPRTLYIVGMGINTKMLFFAGLSKGGSLIFDLWAFSLCFSCFYHIVYFHFCSMFHFHFAMIFIWVPANNQNALYNFRKFEHFLVVYDLFICSARFSSLFFSFFGFFFALLSCDRHCKSDACWKAA